LILIVELYNEDCLVGMSRIPDASVDMILCDLPYGTTACKWDEVIPFEPLWKQYKRIIKPNGAIVLNASQPFTTKLIASNYSMFKYCWVWKKGKCSNFTHAKNMPLKQHEDICVFSKGSIGHECQLHEKRMKYNPQGLIKVDAVWHRPQKYNSEHKLDRESHSLNRIIEFTNYPKTIIEFDNSSNSERGMHPTQKPVELLEYLIRTYTDDGETVLDNCMGSGSTAVAAINTHRNFIGFELDSTYYEVAKNRIYNHITDSNMQDSYAIIA
jgi:site-specific DNA-methyltransferase (adenine-specific)